MTRRCFASAVFTAVLITSAFTAPSTALDIYGKRFAPPRAYLIQPTLNKSGTVAALPGRDNFLRIFLPPIDTATPEGRAIDPAKLRFTVTLPAGVTILEDTPKLTTGSGELDGQPAVTAKGTFDAKEVKLRCLDNAYGIERIVWFQLDESFEPGDTRPIRLQLHHGDELVFTDDATLRIEAELTPPPTVSPKHFKLYLHYGPHYRAGQYDAVADDLRKAGINAVQIMGWNLELMEEMAQRDFYIIAQRGGSYHGLYAHLADVVEQGPAWYESDDDGVMAKTMRYADAVILDAEPTPADYDPDPRIHAMFRDRLGLPVDAPMDETTVKSQHLSEWIAFRQDLFATAVKHWADWTRSLKPGVETILTEGRCNIFDPTSQIDYRKVGDAVTFYDPMNYAGLNAVQGMKQWKAAAPDLRFMGCQNLAYTSYSPVFISAQTVGLQTLSAALLGNAGTSIYPGQTMDAENFIVFNRVMTFLGKHESIIWDGTPDPAEAMLTLLPKEDSTITLGNGQSIRNTYPDWDRDAVARTYRSNAGDEYLAVVTNWNASEPCYARLAIPGLDGEWMVVDDESKAVMQVGGQSKWTASQLAQGVSLKVPPSDFRGVRVARFDESAARGLDAVNVDETDAAYREYAAIDGGSGDGAESSLIAYDDFDADGQFEYVVETDAQKVWISQRGHVVRWLSGDALLETAGMGLCRDQLFMPTGEQSNQQLDALMALRSRRDAENHVELVFERDVALDSLGGMVDVQITRTFTIGKQRPDVGVEVKFLNASLSMTVKSIDLSYRVHNHVASAGPDARRLWLDTDNTLFEMGTPTGLTISSNDLSDHEQDMLFSQYDVAGPHRITALGEYMRESKMLLSYAPRDPDTLLQALRWRSASGDQATVEWMYLPINLPSGDSWAAAYDMSLYSGVAALDHEAVTAARPRPPVAAEGGTLLLHLDFEDGLDAIVGEGDPAATVSGDPTLVPTPTGHGIKITGDSGLSFNPAQHIDLNRGKLAVRFMPLWEGSDQQSHELLVVNPSHGHVYLAKLADGRLLMNMFDKDNVQHWPWTIVNTMKRDTWHDVAVTWDAAKGRMVLYLDHVKVAEHQGEPWEMGAFNAGSRLTIPGSAEAVIDDLKIWDRP